MTIWTYQAISKEEKIISDSILKQSCLPWRLSRDENLNDSQQYEKLLNTYRKILSSPVEI